MRRRVATPWLVALVLSLATPAVAGSVSLSRVEFQLRGRALTLSVYTPGGAPKGTVIMGSGDVGWVGLGVTMAEFLSGQGYLVVGLNVRQYLSSFTTATGHLEVGDPPEDYFALAEHLRQLNLLPPPVVVSGMSEGAALAVLAASSPKNHGWIRGVITMGIPRTAELAWRWTDIGAWITKSDAREPSFSPTDFIAAVSPIPLYMLQSTRDEYVSQADYTLMDRTAKEPKKLVLIDAASHRFTGKHQELQERYLEGLAWIRSFTPPSSRGSA